MSKILAVVSHPDDEILGLGGTLIKHVEDNDEVYCLILGEGVTSRKGLDEDEKNEKLRELKKQTGKAGQVIGFKDIFFSDFPDNKFDEVPLLDIIQNVENHIDEIQPDIIYTHFYDDLNVDHRRTFEAVITATRPFGDYNTKEIYCFETPSSTEWNFKNKKNNFDPNYFVDISDTIEEKMEALRLYENEMRNYPHPRSPEAIKTIAKRWGTVVGKKYVEAFELIRKVRD